MGISFLTLVGCGVSGKIVDSDGEGVQGVTMTISNGITSQEVVTDGEGNYRFDSLVLGRYTITPALWGYAFKPNSIDVGISDTIEDIKDVDFRLTETLFQEEFDNILDNLISNFWAPDGNWEGDAQGDATAFAPMVLYPVGKEMNNQEMIEKANLTVDYEVALINEFLVDRRINMDLVIGYPALAEGYKYTGNLQYGNLLSLATLAGSTLIAEKPELLLDFVFDYATVFGTGSYMCFVTHDALSNDLFKANVFKEQGISLIEKAEAYWNEEGGYYNYSRVLDWPQATMMMALTKAYKETGEQKYLDRCDAILDFLNTLWDWDRGGYFGHLGLTGKGLSGNNNIAWALLDLYELTGNPMYIQRAKATIEWMLSADMYDPSTITIAHHWIEGEGRAQYHCTGCNFQSLYNIYRFNKLWAGM